MLKYIFILSFLGVISFNSANAQIEKGSKLLGGDMSFNIGSNEYFENRHFSFQPTFHYFLTDRLAIGLGINYSYSKNIRNTFPSYSEQYSHGLGLMPEFRYYKRLSDKLYLFGNSQLDFSRRVSYYREDVTETFERWVPFSSISMNFGGGLAYFITSKIQIEGYTRVLSLEYRNDLEFSGISTHFSFQYMGLAFRYLL